MKVTIYIPKSPRCDFFFYQSITMYNKEMLNNNIFTYWNTCRHPGW